MDENDDGVDELLQTLFAPDKLCLSGRDPGCDTVRHDLICALTLQAQYMVTVDSCLETASQAFDALTRDLKRGPARKLRRTWHEISTMIDQLSNVDISSLLDESEVDDISEILERFWHEDGPTRMN